MKHDLNIAQLSGKLVIEESQANSSRNNSNMGGFYTLSFLRLCAVGFFMRFVWLYFANISHPFYGIEGKEVPYHIGQPEACAWLVWMLFGFIHWTWLEKERLCDLWDASEKNTANAIPNESASL